MVVFRCYVSLPEGSHETPATWGASHWKRLDCLWDGLRTNPVRAHVHCDATNEFRGMGSERIVADWSYGTSPEFVSDFQDENGSIWGSTDIYSVWICLFLPLVFTVFVGLYPIDLAQLAPGSAGSRYSWPSPMAMCPPCPWCLGQSKLESRATRKSLWAPSCTKAAKMTKKWRNG